MHTKAHIKPSYWPMVATFSPMGVEILLCGVLIKYLCDNSRSLLYFLTMTFLQLKPMVCTHT